MWPASPTWDRSSSRPTPAPTSTSTDALSPTSTWCKASVNNQRSLRASLGNAPIPTVETRRLPSKSRIASPVHTSQVDSGRLTAVLWCTPSSRLEAYSGRTDGEGLVRISPSQNMDCPHCHSQVSSHSNHCKRCGGAIPSGQYLLEECGLTKPTSAGTTTTASAA